LRPTALLLCLCAATLTAHAQKPTSGFYGDHTLQLVTAADGSFTAAFYDETGAGKFSCGFLLHSDGHPSAHNVYKVVTWWPYTDLDGTGPDEVVRGTLTATPKGLTLQLPKQAHGGCTSVNIDLDEGGPIDLDRDKEHDPTLTHDQNHAASPSPATWQSIRVIKAPRVSLRPQPNATSTRPYIVHGDVVIVTATQGAWLHVLFYSYEGGKSFTGWLQESELAPAHIP
jgi:hypothetical protein